MPENKVIKAKASLITLLHVMLLVLLGYFFKDTATIFATSWSQEEYSHGSLIVIVSLLWGVTLCQQSKLAPRPSAYGLGVLATGILLHFLGLLIVNTWVSEFAVLVAITGLVISTLGTKISARLWPALTFALFAIPLPPILHAALTAKMQLLSSTLGVMGLHTLGQSVFQDGNIIDLGTYKLQVAEACSGLRYLFPLLSFGFLAAFMGSFRWWMRPSLIASTIPFAIVMNAFRITVIGLTVNWWGIEAAEGLAHQLEGWVVFALCLGFLGAEMWLFARFVPDIIFTSFLPSRQPVLNNGLPFRPILVTLLFVLIGTSLGGQHYLAKKQRQAIPFHKPLVTFPLEPKGWTGRPNTLPQDQLEALKLSDYFIADYHQKEGSEALNFYVAYYASQRLGASPHSPKVCLPGGGWEMASLDPTFTFETGTTPHKLTVNRAIIKKGEATLLVYFWLRERGRDVASNLDIKRYLLVDALKNGRSDGALVRVMIPVPDKSNITAQDQTLQDFIAATLPALNQFVPEIHQDE